jgi:hypothetical protein
MVDIINGSESKPDAVCERCMKKIPDEEWIELKLKPGSHPTKTSYIFCSPCAMQVLREAK